MRYLIAYIRKRNKTMSGDPPIDNHTGEPDPLELIFDKLDQGQVLNDQAVTFLRSEIRHLNEERLRLDLNERELRRKFGHMSDELTETQNRLVEANGEIQKQDRDKQDLQDKLAHERKRAQAQAAELKLLNESLAKIQKQLQAWKEENDAARLEIDRLEIRRHRAGQPEGGTVKG